MVNTTRDIQRFLFGQHFADGFRMAVLIVAPALAASYFGYFDIGLTISIGALCVSICDTPGPVHHKRNAMLISSLLIFVVSLMTGFLRMNIWVMGTSLTVLGFTFAMLTIYGARASLLGTSILLLMVLQMDKVFEPLQILHNSLYLTAGALWYTVISIGILQLFPYRAAQRALGECIRETAACMSLRAMLYDTSLPLEEVFTKLIAQQVIINDKQNEVRELLFKNKKIPSQSNHRAIAMILTFDEVIDLYEKISASHVDYTAIRELHEDSGILKKISTVISEMAKMLDTTGAAIQYNFKIKNQIDIDTPMRRLRADISSTVKDHQPSVLDSLLMNIEILYRVVSDLQHYLTDDYAALDRYNTNLEHARFVTHQSLDPKLFRFNLSFDSQTFRHSVRMALACLTGFLLSKFILHGQHTYWLLITIIFVLKPAYSLTRERNRQRIIGTLIGGLIGVVILFLIHNTAVLFICMFICMLMTFSFQRHRYMVAMIFMTPYILILFHFVHVGLVEVAQERVIDTVVGSIIALIAGYLILPGWESDQIIGNMKRILHANYRYLLAIRDSLSGAAIPVTEYKLIRKDVYVSTSNLSAALQRMLSEPKHTQKNIKEIKQFSILNHLLSSHIASVKDMITVTDAEEIAWAKKALNTLDDTIRQMDKPKNPISAVSDPTIDSMEYKTPFESIYKLSKDIQQITQAILC